MIAPSAPDGVIEFFIFRRIDDIHAARHHRDGAGCQRAFMRRGVDAARQARRHRQPGRAQIARQDEGEFARQRRGVARADDRDHLALQQMRHGPAPRSPAAADPARPGRAEIPARRTRSAGRPACASASSLARDVFFRRQHEVLAAAARAPAAAILPAPRRRQPKRAIRLAKVTGPTFSVRASLSQARRSLSSSVRAICSFSRRCAVPRRAAAGGYFPGA